MLNGVHVQLADVHIQDHGKTHVKVNMVSVYRLVVLETKMGNQQNVIGGTTMHTLNVYENHTTVKRFFKSFFFFNLKFDTNVNLLLFNFFLNIYNVKQSKENTIYFFSYISVVYVQIPF